MVGVAGFEPATPSSRTQGHPLPALIYQQFSSRSNAAVVFGSRHVVALLRGALGRMPILFFRKERFDLPPKKRQLLLRSSYSFEQSERGFVEFLYGSSQLPIGFVKALRTFGQGLR
jgi:hypothetical protein